MPEFEKPPVPDPASTADPAATPAAPAGVTISQDKWDEMNAKIAHMTGEMEGLRSVAGRPVTVQAAAAPAPVRQYTDDELGEMLESGDGKKILLANRILLQQQTQPIVDDYQRFRAQTMHMGETLGREVVEQSGRVPHLKDPVIRKQVDEFMLTLPAEARASKDAIEFAHNYVVGKKENLDRIVKAQVEEELRKRDGTAGAVDASGARTGRVPAEAGSKIPSVTELLGEGSAQALRAKGQTPDEFAKRSGWKNWADYASYITEQQNAEAEGVEEV